MNRREFLKLGSAAIAVAVFPKIAVDAARTNEGVPVEYIEPYDFAGIPLDHHWDDFLSEFEYGNGLLLTARPTPAVQERMLVELYADMTKHIPPMYRDRVKIYGPVPVDYGHSISVAWKYS